MSFTMSTPWRMPSRVARYERSVSTARSSAMCRTVDSNDPIAMPTRLTGRSLARAAAHRSAKTARA